MFQNGFLAFGDGPTDAKLVKCGLHLGGQRNYTIIDGDRFNLKQTKIDYPGDPMSLFEVEVTFDPRSRKVAMEARPAGKPGRGETIVLTLDRDLKEIKYVGYYVKHAVTAFSPVEVVGK